MDDDYIKRIDNLFGVSRRMYDYSCHWSHRYNYIYIDVPFAYTTPVKALLQLAEVDGDESRLPKQATIRDASPFARVSQNPHSFFELLDNEDTLWFTFVTNPFVRTCSLYRQYELADEKRRERIERSLKQKNTSKLTLKEFIQAIQSIPDDERSVFHSSQKRIIQPDRLQYDFMGRTEHLYIHLAKLCEVFGLPESYLERAMETARASLDYRTLANLDQEDEERIADAYDVDFLDFAYGYGLDFANM